MVIFTRLLQFFKICTVWEIRWWVSRKRVS
jgi:hypothetical protein